jgi:hypothetical protein
VRRPGEPAAHPAGHRFLDLRSVLQTVVSPATCRFQSQSIIDCSGSSSSAALHCQIPYEARCRGANVTVKVHAIFGFLVLAVSSRSNRSL